MKNCELNIRTIDEGALDEKSGMNFSEYIAILSGDTSLLEKSKLEKKIAVLESVKVAHHKELLRAKFQLDIYKTDKSNAEHTLERLIRDATFYSSCLQYEKDGTKANPIQIHGCNSSDTETIGKHLITLNAEWKPKADEHDELKIGSLYDFALHIRREKQAFEDKGMFEYHFHNTFYAESKETGLKYSWNNGYINTDNAKLAARFFLNAIDRVESLKERYQKSAADLNQNIQMMEQIVTKPFGKHDELLQLKMDVAKLEREISIKIQTNQMKQHEGELKPVPEKNEAMVVDLNADKNSHANEKLNKQVLITKNELLPKKVKGFRI